METINYLNFPHVNANVQRLHPSLYCNIFEGVVRDEHLLTRHLPKSLFCLRDILANDREESERDLEEIRLISSRKSDAAR